MPARPPYLSDFLAFDSGRQILQAASAPTGFEERDGDVLVALPLVSLAQPPAAVVPAVLRLRAYGSGILRLTLTPEGKLPAGDSPMMAWAEDLRPEPLTVKREGEVTAVRDARGGLRAQFSPQPKPAETWSRLLPAPPELLQAAFYPDGRTSLGLMAHDAFFPGENASLGLFAVSDAATGRWERAGFSLHAEANERFAGTGERFARLDLAGRTLSLWNEDALGVNNRRAYKNVPFLRLEPSPTASSSTPPRGSGSPWRRSRTQAAQGGRRGERARPLSCSVETRSRRSSAGTDGSRDSRPRRPPGALAPGCRA